MYRALLLMSLATRDIMDSMFEVYLDAANEPDDIPNTTDPVWILGKKFSALEDLGEIRKDIVSKLWFSYRKNFQPIGGSNGLTTDKGWGCMLRCGQMVLAQALINTYLGRDWTWDPQTKDPTYLKILDRFSERRSAPYSIHQIATMGETEGKLIGEWFGPNTVAQVLKKLIQFDETNPLEIHVALDNAIIINDIKKLCNKCTSDETGSNSTPSWRPLLLIVPLRLGLTEMNPIYVSGLQKCFRFRQSLGVIGGKPNLALYFIGYVGKEVIYLDPHTTQRARFVDKKDTEDQIEMDITYHCRYASRVNILSLDPSVAVCFYCKTEADFNDLCEQFKVDLIQSEAQPLFEVAYEKPDEYFAYRAESVTGSEFINIRTMDSETESSDHDFEIL